MKTQKYLEKLRKQSDSCVLQGDLAANNGNDAEACRLWDLASTISQKIEQSEEENDAELDRLMDCIDRYE